MSKVIKIFEKMDVFDYLDIFTLTYDFSKKKDWSAYMKLVNLCSKYHLLVAEAQEYFKADLA